MTSSPLEYDIAALIAKYYDTKKQDRFSLNEMNAYDFFGIKKNQEINPILAQGLKSLSVDTSPGQVQGNQELMEAHEKINELIKQRRDLLLENLEKQKQAFIDFGYSALYENIKLQINEQYQKINTPESRVEYDEGLKLMDEVLRDPNLSRIEDFVDHNFDSDSELLELDSSLDSEVFDLSDNEKQSEPKPNFISAFFSGIVNFFKNLFKSSSNEKSDKSRDKLSSTEEIHRVLQESESSHTKAGNMVNESRKFREEVKGHAQAERDKRALARAEERQERALARAEERQERALARGETAKQRDENIDYHRSASRKGQLNSTSQMPAKTQELKAIRSEYLKKNQEGIARLRARRNALDNATSKPLGTKEADKPASTSGMRR